MSEVLNPLKNKLMEDMKIFMKNKEQKKLGYLRMLLSEVKNVEINNRENFKPEMALSAVSSYQKKLKKSLSEFAKFPDKKAEIQEEIDFCQLYLPQELSDEELKNQLKNLIETSSEKSLGVLMKLAMKELNGKASGDRVQNFLKSLLN